METSTPMVQTPMKRPDLHRRTLLRNAIEVEASPLRRRSALATPTPVLEKSNDESERLKRRTLVDIQRRLSNIPQQGSPLNESTKFIGEQEMKDHFQICTKLFAENKITPKNAWQLHIIDLLRHMSQKAGTSENLQVASTSLDISAKVYGIRVDDIHSDGMKLASTMARVSEKQTPQQIEDEEGAEPGEEGDKANAAAKRKKKRKRLSLGQKNTIAKDPSTLLGALPKLESVFFSTRTNAETSAIDNLFTNVLPMDNSSYKFMLLSREKAWPSGPDPAVADVAAGVSKKYPLKINPQKDLTICAPFNDFIVDQWDPVEEEKLLPEKTNNIQRENEVVFDDHGIPIAELDGSIHDIFADDHDHENLDLEEDQPQEEHCQEFQAHIHGEIANIVDFSRDDVQRTEYSYNSVISTQSGKVIDQIWAGPSHWKLKFIRRSSVKFSGQVVEKQTLKSTRRRQKGQLQPINFDNINNVRIDKTKKLKIKKKPHTVDPQKITLPVPDSSSVKLMEHIQELMTKPGVRPVRKSELENQNPLDYEVSAYNYENPNDSHYCPNNAVNDMDDNDADNGMPDDGDFNDQEEMVMAGQQNFMGENLVDVPELVPKSYVTYALQAKKMDMKKLKDAVWQSLVQQKGKVKEANDRSGEVVPTTFSKLYKVLPELLNDKMRSELSCPLAFVALLHLCNEQNLELQQHLNYKDFGIAGPISQHMS